jgi:hypothetical protein
MGVSSGQVSQILGGGEDLTLRALAALSIALDARFDIEQSALQDGETYTSRRAETAPARASTGFCPNARQALHYPTRIRCMRPVLTS